MEEKRLTSCEGEFLTDLERNDPERKVYHYLPEPADNRSVMEMLAELSTVNPAEYEQVVEDLIATKGEEWVKGLPYDWTVNSRPKQRVPTPKDRWRFWVILAGRGWGKTKTGAETVKQWVDDHPAGTKPLRIALVGATASDVNGVMIGGDALDLDTPIPTPDGWKSMNDVHTGDKVFSEDGTSCNVLWESPVYIDRPCYEVVFSDGSSIIADENHKWYAETRKFRRVKDKNINSSEETIKTVFTTKELLNDLFFTNIKGKMYNYSVPVARPLQYTVSNSLPIHPYVLGYWLGDGTSKGQDITTMDIDVVNHITNLGYSVSLQPHSVKDGFKARTYGILKLKSKLQELNLLRNKHIPSNYLTAPVEDRIELLKGLMDADGYCGKSGRVYFSNSSTTLLSNFEELIAGLGLKFKSHLLKPGKQRFIKKLSQINHEIGFAPAFEVFHIQRKLERQKITYHPKANYRTVVAVFPVESRPTKCIAVDSSNHLYLAGRNCVPTHNSGILSCYPEKQQPHWTTTTRRLTWYNPDGTTKAIAEAFALDVNTEIPTPDGFKLMGDIKVGDQVFDEGGFPTDVVSVTDVFNEHICYELVFKNGQKIVADAAHLWKVSTFADRDKRVNKDRVVDTQYIFDNFTVPHKGRKNDLNIWVKLTEPVLYAKKDLPIPPYTLGAWLGDGSRSDGRVTSATAEIPNFVSADGYIVKQTRNPIVFQIHGLISQLKELGLYKNKHIPDIYKQSSIEQRKELLRGLLDTDGTVSKIGEIVFGNTNENLIDGVCEVVASLGGWATKRLCKPRENNPYTDNEKPVWKVTIRGLYDIFKLPRKLERAILRRVSADLPVVSIKKIESVPVRCITVDSSEHLFLATRSYIVTRNSAEEPERLRGPQFHKAWLDELAAWRYEYALEMLRFGLRLGDNPQAIVTTTPRPFPILLNLLREEGTWTTKGSTYENRSNLAPAFFDEVINKYKGTRLGEQELMAEILDGVKDAMWNEVNINQNRIEFHELHKLPELLSVVLAIDPATTTRTSSAETGMCIAAYGENDHFYILHLAAMKESPETWARAAIKLFKDYKCDKMIAEVNNGGDLVEAVIRAANPMQKVFAVHASRGKTTRAEPIAALYEQNRVHHVGRFSSGEQQMTSFNPIENPYGYKDMVDALVWAMTYLVDITQGRNTYQPAIGGERTKINTYKRIFRY